MQPGNRCNSATCRLSSCRTYSMNRSLASASRSCSRALTTYQKIACRSSVASTLGQLHCNRVPTPVVIYRSLSTSSSSGAADSSGSLSNNAASSTSPLMTTASAAGAQSTATPPTAAERTNQRGVSAYLLLGVVVARGAQHLYDICPMITASAICNSRLFCNSRLSVHFALRSRFRGRRWRLFSCLAQALSSFTTSAEVKRR